MTTVSVFAPRIDATPLAIETRDLVKYFYLYGPLRGLDLTVPEGAFYALVGPNGAGKTTTLRILLDLVRADAGTAEILGISTRNPLARAQIGWVPEKHDEQYDWMRVRQLIAHHSAYYPTWDDAYAKQLLERLGIRAHHRFSWLSKGEARRVQLVLALAHRPPVLLLDEPTDGLDPFARETVLGIIAEHLADSSATVLASTHQVHELEGLADHIGVLRDGVLTVQMHRDALQRNLRHYTLALPDDWTGDAGLGHALLRTNGIARESRWTVWGEEAEVTGRLSDAGARVRSVVPATLEESALALLARKESE